MSHQRIPSLVWVKIHSQTHTLRSICLHAPLVLPNSKSGRQPAPCLIHQRGIKSSAKLRKALLQSLLFTFISFLCPVWSAIQVSKAKKSIIRLISYEQKRIKFTDCVSKVFCSELPVDLFQLQYCKIACY